MDKSDVEKGVDSDNAANELCDLVEDIVERVPYLRVLVSMLTPRFDLQVSGFALEVARSQKQGFLRFGPPLQVALLPKFLKIEPPLVFIHCQLG